MSRPLDSVGVSMYLQEAYELADSLLWRLDRIEKARDQWLLSRSRADEQVGAAVDDFEHDVFAEALNSSTLAQSDFFLELEAFLAGWARLSLLFWPAPGRNSPIASFTQDRGRILRDFLQLDNSHPLNDRNLRDAWMHTDERFDSAWLDGRWGNRQQFVRTKNVGAAIKNSVRVLDVEGLTVHFRDAKGTVRAQELRPLRDVLLDLVQRRKDAFATRMHTLPSGKP